MTEADGKPRASTGHARAIAGARPWNIAVRTRGIFTHRDDFQKLACVERGLVRTARGGTGRD